jgi:hypothetical protein
MSPDICLRWNQFVATTTCFHHQNRTLHDRKQNAENVQNKSNVLSNLDQKQTKYDARIPRMQVKAQPNLADFNLPSPVYTWLYYSPTTLKREKPKCNAINPGDSRYIYTYRIPVHTKTIWEKEWIWKSYGEERKSLTLSMDRFTINRTGTTTTLFPHNI